MTNGIVLDYWLTDRYRSHHCRNVLLWPRDQIQTWFIEMMKTMFVWALFILQCLWFFTEHRFTLRLQQTHVPQCGSGSGSAPGRVKSIHRNQTCSLKKLLEEMSLNRIWASRLVPLWSDPQMKTFGLKDWTVLVSLMSAAPGKFTICVFSRTNHFHPPESSQEHKRMLHQTSLRW